MSLKIALLWIVLVAVIGFALGGSVVWSFQAPPKEWYQVFLDNADGWSVAIFSGLLVFVTWRLVTSTNKLWEAAERQIEVARSAAAAASENVDISRLSMVASDRAYVHYAGCRWISHRDVNDGTFFWSIRPQWTNSGNTPTREAHVHIRYELLDERLPADYDFAPNDQAVQTPATLPPKATIFSAHYNIKGEDLVAIREGRKHFYVWGIAHYRDVFPGTPNRITKFCSYAGRIAGNPLEGWDDKSNPVEILFLTYHRHNCSDEECESSN